MNSATGTGSGVGPAKGKAIPLGVEKTLDATLRSAVGLAPAGAVKDHETVLDSIDKFFSNPAADELPNGFSYATLDGFTSTPKTLGFALMTKKKKPLAAFFVSGSDDTNDGILVLAVRGDRKQTNTKFVAMDNGIAGQFTASLFTTSPKNACNFHPWFSSLVVSFSTAFDVSATDVLSVSGEFAKNVGNSIQSNRIVVALCTPNTVSMENVLHKLAHGEPPSVITKEEAIRYQTDWNGNVDKKEFPCIHVDRFQTLADAIVVSSKYHEDCKAAAAVEAAADREVRGWLSNLLKAVDLDVRQDQLLSALVHPQDTFCDADEGPVVAIFKNLVRAMKGDDRFVDKLNGDRYRTILEHWSTAPGIPDTVRHHALQTVACFVHGLYNYSECDDEALGFWLYQKDIWKWFVKEASNSIDNRTLRDATVIMLITLDGVTQQKVLDAHEFREFLVNQFKSHPKTIAKYVVRMLKEQTCPGIDTTVVECGVVHGLMRGSAAGNKDSYNALSDVFRTFSEQARVRAVEMDDFGACINDVVFGNGATPENVLSAMECLVGIHMVVAEHVVRRGYFEMLFSNATAHASYAFRERTRLFFESIYGNLSPEAQTLSLSSKAFVPFVVNAFMDKSNASWMYHALPQDEKIRVFVRVKELDKANCAHQQACLGSWLVGLLHSTDKLEGETTDAFEKRRKFVSKNQDALAAAKKLYEKEVACLLGKAFKAPRRIDTPDVPSLVEVSRKLGLEGTPRERLIQLAPHLNAYEGYLHQLWLYNSTANTSKEELNRQAEQRVRAARAATWLRLPSQAIEKRFSNAMPLDDVDVDGQAGQSAAASSKPEPMAIKDYLGPCFSLRESCSRCKVLTAEGDDGDKARLEFTNPEDRGRGRLASNKRGCPLMDHAITTTGSSNKFNQDAMALFDDYDRDYPAAEFNRPATYSVVKRKEIMRDVIESKFKIQRLGCGPHYAVSLYDPAPSDSTKEFVVAGKFRDVYGGLELQRPEPRSS